MGRLNRAVFGVAVLVACAAQADVVVPNSAAGTEGDGAFSLTSTGSTGRTFQLTIASSQLTALVGQQIFGLQWRLNAAATAAWPPVNTTYAFWDVFMGPGVAPSAMSNTFASNFSAAPTQVRSGPAAFTAGGHTFGGSPNAFGEMLSFTSPYLYTGGDLTLEMRFAAQVGSTVQSPFDAVVASGGPANGWGVDFAGRWVGNATATTGGNANFLVTNFVVPAPSSMALLGLSLGVALRRNRRR